MAVGETGTLTANQKNEGGIPKYLWEVIPAQAGTIAQADQPTTTFEAKAAGKAVFRLTARDGLYQVISQCSTEIITFASLVVTLEADPPEPAAGDTVTLTCSTGRAMPVGTRRITQVDGDSVELSLLAEGVATFPAPAEGDLSFRCVAESEAGETAESGLLTLTVAASPDEPADNETGGGDNENGNDNAAGPPPRPPVRR